MKLVNKQSSWKGRRLKMKLVLLQFSVTARRSLVPKIAACIMHVNIACIHQIEFLDGHIDITYVHTLG